MKVEDKPLTMLLAEKTEHVWQAQHDFRTGFLADSEGDLPAERGHPETARFPGEPLLAAADHALERSVSIIVRRHA